MRLKRTVPIVAILRGRTAPNETFTGIGGLLPPFRNHLRKIGAGLERLRSDPRYNRVPC